MPASGPGDNTATDAAAEIDDHGGGVALLDSPETVTAPLRPVRSRADDERSDGTDVVPIGAIPGAQQPVTPRRLQLPSAPQDREFGWVVTVIVTAIGAMVRFWNLGARTDGGTPLFDEKYYALNTAEVIRLGGIEENAAYPVVVHPPLGKQIMALGQWLFGYTPIGWRFMSAIAGVLCILLIIRVARRLTGSTMLGGIAGILLICDGVSHVNARTALLDVFQELFVLAAFACLIADRDQVRARLAAAWADNAPGLTSRFGPRLGFRWWRFATALMLGCATGVKWSGIYWIAFFGVLSVVWDVLARRQAGVRKPVLGTAVRDLLPSLWAYVVVGIGSYLATWWAWFASESAWARHAFMADSWGWDSQGLKSLAGIWHNSMWQWTWKMLDFHSNLLTPENASDRHPWESKPWTWPMGLRPVLYYAPGDKSFGNCGNGTEDCAQRIFLIGTPMMWWIALFVAGWALWRMVLRQDWRYAAVVIGYTAGYLPWFINLDRQMYFFYMTPVAPFLVLGITLLLGDILGSRRLGLERKTLSIAIVAGYTGLVAANFIWLWPMLTGSPITKAMLQMQTWIPSWG